MDRGNGETATNLAPRIWRGERQISGYQNRSSLRLARTEGGWGQGGARGEDGAFVSLGTISGG